MDRKDRKEFEWITDIPSTKQYNDIHEGIEYRLKTRGVGEVRFTVLSIKEMYVLVETEHGDEFPFDIVGFEKNLKDKTVIKYEDYLKAKNDPTSEEAAKYGNYI
jgi:hypothetical protein